MSKIKRIIKQSVVGGVATRIADLLNDPSAITLAKRLKSATEKTAVLVGTPCHHNLGDHLIAENETQFLVEKCGIEQVIEIPTRIFLSNQEMVRSNVNQRCPVFISGGGWMGDLWPEDQEIMERMIATFQKNRVIILPQTIYYCDVTQSNASILETRKVLSDAHHLMIMCRDRASMDTAMLLFGDLGIEIELFPDLGLYRRPIHKTSARHSICLCLRNDRESCFKSNIVNTITSVAAEHGVEVCRDSTISKHAVSIWQRKRELNKLIKRFSLSEIVITDRLHGMVFSALAGTKCMAFDNKTHKVKGVYSLWLKGNPNVIMMDTENSEEIIKRLNRMLEANNDDGDYYRLLVTEFDTMAKRIQELNI